MAGKSQDSLKRAGKQRRKDDQTDPQREALYGWEDEWRDWNVNSLTLAECRWAVRTACAKYKLTAPPVGQHHAALYSHYDTGLNRISLQAKSRRNVKCGTKNLAICLHEATHYILWRKWGDRVQDHGPTFLGIYLFLLNEARIAPLIALTASARAAGLRWRPMPPRTYADARIS